MPLGVQAGSPTRTANVADPSPKVSTFETALKPGDHTSSSLSLDSWQPGPASAKVLLHADSAFYGHGGGGAAVRAGAQVSVTVRLDPTVKATIATIPAHAWQAIEYTDGIYDQTTGRGSRPRRYEIPFTAFAAPKKANQIPGRLVVRRIPDLGAQRQVHGKRRLARLGGECVQPDPRRGDPGRPRHGQGHHRDHPPQAGSRAGPDRVLGSAPDNAPAECVALGNALTTLFTGLCEPPPPVART